MLRPEAAVTAALDAISSLHPPAHPDPSTVTPVTQTPLEAATARLKAANAEPRAAYADHHVQELAELAREIRPDHPAAASMVVVRWCGALDDYGGNLVTADQLFDQHGAEIEGRSQSGWYAPPAGGRFQASTAHMYAGQPLLADAVIEGGNADEWSARLDLDCILAAAEDTPPNPTTQTGTAPAWERATAANHAERSATSDPTPAASVFAI